MRDGEDTEVVTELTEAEEVPEMFSNDREAPVEDISQTIITGVLSQGRS